MAVLAVSALRAYAQRPPAYYDPPNILRFAESLYQEGDFLRAAIEYRRYLSVFSPPNDEADKTLLRIAICYRLGGQADAALTYFQKLIRESAAHQQCSEAIIQSGLTWFSLGKYDAAAKFLASADFRSEEDAVYRQKKNALIGASLLMQSRWREAQAQLSSLPPEELSSLESSLKSLSVKGTKLPHKSPFFGGALSAIVPGLGRIYAKRTFDGLYSLVTIGLAGWQAYDGFHKGGVASFKGWVFGILGSVLYIGNIYGSAISVQIFNRGGGEKLHNEVRLLIEANF